MHKVHRQVSRVPNARVKLCPGVSASVAGCMPHRAENENLLEEVDMDSGMIGKIEKSKRYAEEPERIRFEEFRSRMMEASGTARATFLPAGGCAAIRWRWSAC